MEVRRSPQLGMVRLITVCFSFPCFDSLSASASTACLLISYRRARQVVAPPSLPNNVLCMLLGQGMHRWWFGTYMWSVVFHGRARVPQRTLPLRLAVILSGISHVAPTASPPTCMGYVTAATVFRGFVIPIVTGYLCLWIPSVYNIRSLFSGVVFAGRVVFCRFAQLYRIRNYPSVSLSLSFLSP